MTGSTLNIFSVGNIYQTNTLTETTGRDRTQHLQRYAYVDTEMRSLRSSFHDLASYPEIHSR